MLVDFELSLIEYDNMLIIRSVNSKKIFRFTFYHFGHYFHLSLN